MTKKDNVKKDTKKTKKEQIQPVVDVETVMTEINEETLPDKDNKEINEETPISESADIVVTLNGDGIEAKEESTDNDVQQDKEVKENTENRQNKKIESTKEAVKKKRVTTNEMFGYNWMGQIYDI